MQAGGDGGDQRGLMFGHPPGNARFLSLTNFFAAIDTENKDREDV